MGRMVSLCRLRCENDVTVREPGGGSQYRTRFRTRRSINGCAALMYRIVHHVAKNVQIISCKEKTLPFPGREKQRTNV